ncbi:MAG: methylmalonyl-CoA mutase family protein, partial [Firmicutes bacterium]|nr:methylmalonyl-CoA mutase family protein [Bacillota bacterium]
ERQKERIAQVKSRRDASRVAAALQSLRQAALGTGNLMPPIIESVREYATLGEICDTLRDVFGEYKSSVTF